MISSHMAGAMVCGCPAITRVACRGPGPGRNPGTATSVATLFRPYCSVLAKRWAVLARLQLQGLEGVRTSRSFRCIRHESVEALGALLRPRWAWRGGWRRPHRSRSASLRRSCGFSRAPPSAQRLSLRPLFVPSPREASASLGSQSEAWQCPSSEVFGTCQCLQDEAVVEDLYDRTGSLGSFSHLLPIRPCMAAIQLLLIACFSALPEPSHVFFVGFLRTSMCFLIAKPPSLGCSGGVGPCSQRAAEDRQTWGLSRRRDGCEHIPL